MGKHISKAARHAIAIQKQQQEQLIQQAYQQAKRANQSFIGLITEAQHRPGSNAYPNSAQYQWIVSFIGQNERFTKKETLHKWIDNLIYLTQHLEKKCPKWFKETDYLRALVEVGKYRSSWIRPLEQWKPNVKSDYERFKELVTYLFAQYPFPNVLNHLFFHSQDHFFIRDFIYLVQGGSLKQLTTRIPLTHKMKTEFMKSPEGFRIDEAFRYAQVIGLGGDTLLAHRIAYSWLGRNETRDERFWEGFLRILIAGGLFNHDKISELIDYVRHELHQSPTYSLKGRTLTSLLRQSDAWHQNLSKTQRKEGLVFWTSALFEPFELTEGKEEDELSFKVVELLSNKELADEGNAMKHCVGSYSYYCQKGKTRIVSLRKFKLGVEVERMATIEVDLSSRRIVQAKYRFNQPISPKAMRFLQYWAGQNGLSIGKHL
ncbi:MAG: PcfJ domain-containing protein [Spirosomataceae bacterium]